MKAQNLRTLEVGTYYIITLKTVPQVLKKVKRNLPHDSAISFLEVYPREMKHEFMQKHVHTHQICTQRKRKGRRKEKEMAIKRKGQIKTIGESESRVYGSCFYYSVNILKFETTSKFKFIKKRARTSCSKLLLSTSSMKTIYSLKVIKKL